eukprot:GHVS01036362.1.p1 GENE.GHVS01036362.1~~GHVS01036362.1.p1  ORF type:complete len:540 (-),score=69.98 GHVS01036362.1:413-1789(-)
MPHPLMRPAAPPVMAPPVEGYFGIPAGTADAGQSPEDAMLDSSSHEEDPPTSQMHAEYLQKLQSYHDKYSNKQGDAQTTGMRGRTSGQENRDTDIYDMMNIIKPPTKQAAAPIQAPWAGPRATGQDDRNPDLQAGARVVPPLLKTTAVLPKPGGAPVIPLDALSPAAVANRRSKLHEVYQLRKDMMRRGEAETEGASPDAPLVASTASHSWEPNMTLQQEKQMLRTEGAGAGTPTRIAELRQSTIHGQGAETSDIGSSATTNGKDPAPRRADDNLSPLVLRAKNLLLQSSDPSYSQPPPRPDEVAAIGNVAGTADLSNRRSAVQATSPLLPLLGYIDPGSASAGTAGRQRESMEQPITPPGRHVRDARVQRPGQQVRREIMAGTLGQRGEGQSVTGTPWREIAIDESLKQMVPIFQGVVGAMRNFRQATAGTSPGAVVGGTTPLTSTDPVLQTSFQRG